MMPLIFLIAMIVISYKMYKEYKEKQRVKGIVNYFETDNDNKLNEVQMFIIEQKAQIAVRDYAPHWKMQFRGQFNTAKYVEFLEYKYSKGEL